MFYTLSKFFLFFVAPSHLLVILTVLTLFAFCWSRSSARRLIRAKRTGWVLIVIYAALFFLPVGDWLIFPLEAEAPPAMKMPAKMDGIVVLGAALDENITDYHGMVAVNGQAERVIYLPLLVKRYPTAKVVYAGGSGSQSNKQPEADIAKILFEMWGMNTKNFIFEDKSRNTYENLVNTKALVKPQINQNWLLVTSAAHMPRAIAVAQHMGWEMIPYPVDYVSGGWTGLSSSNIRYNLERLDKATQEYIGLLAYRLSGKA
jgi:uncharacterized SAM-binding protein YcdF (DUF218 family)